jgi:hypothetical protein
MLRNRPSKKAPRAFSSRFTRRDNGSFKHFMNQLRLASRCRDVATQAGFLSFCSTHS